MNFAEIRTKVYALVGDSAASPVYFPKAEVSRYVNDTYRRIARESGCLEIDHQIDVVSGTATYDLPNNIDRIFRVAYDEEPIFPTSVHELDRFDKGWATRSGKVDFFHLDRLNHHKINIWRVPDSESRVAFITELGTVVYLENTYTIRTRLQSIPVGYGVGTDYSQDSDTVVFAAAASGGGADADYGTIVAMSSDEAGATYTFGSELGIMVNLDEETATSFLAESFTTSELGIVTDIKTDDDTDIYIFHDDLNDEYDLYVHSAEVGVWVRSTLSDVTSENGIVVQLTDSDGTDSYVFSREVGIPSYVSQYEVGVITDYDVPAMNLNVWAKEDPDDMINDDDEPRLPHHSHLAIVFGAAATAFKKNSEIRNMALAKLLEGLEAEYTSFLKQLMALRTPEKKHQMKTIQSATRLIRQYPRLPSEYPRMW